MSQRIYLDHAATTTARPEAVRAMQPHLENGYNASSLHAEGRAERAALDDARAAVARCIGARPKEIVFTAGGSEADGLAIAGAARALRSRGNRLVSVATEHHAVLHTLDALLAEGFETALLGVDENGLVDEEAFADALKPATVLASIAYANNETGTLQPIARLARIARERGVLFHTDAVQAPAYVPVDVDTLGVDLLSLAAHKFYGPKGVGALYVRTGTPLAPIIHGGAQEHALRAGTENVAAAAGMAAALELAVAERPETAARLQALRDAFERDVVGRIPDVRVNAAGAPRMPNISNLSLAGVDAQALLVRLDLDGIAVSAGSACASGVPEPSHVLAALGVQPPWLGGTVRFSLGRSTTGEELARTAQALAAAAADLRSAGAARF